MDFLYWVRNLLIFRALYWVVRNLWWVFILILFWPQIEDYLENFRFWWELKWSFIDFKNELESWQIWHELMAAFRSIGRFFIGLFNTIKDAIKESGLTLKESMQILGDKASNLISKN